MKKLSFILITITFILTSCDISFLPFNKYGNDFINYFSAKGVVRGISIDFSTDNARVQIQNNNSIGITNIDTGCKNTGIQFFYSSISDNTIYTDTQISEGSLIEFMIMSDIITESEGYYGNFAESGTLEIYSVEGNIISGNYDVVSNIGDTMSGEFRVKIP